MSHGHPRGEGVFCTDPACRLDHLEGPSGRIHPAARPAKEASPPHPHDHPRDHAHDHAGHPHHHGPGHAHAHGLGAHGGHGSVRRLGSALGLTATIMVAEAVGGWLSGSLALVSDAGHMLTDAGALGLALVAAWLSTRPADDKRTFGYRRAEVLAAQLNVGALLVLSGWIGWEAIERLQAPVRAIDLRLMSIIAGVGLLANVTILWFLHQERSINARSAFLHVVSDTISSVAILAGAAVMAFRPDLRWIDPVLSLAIAGLILWGALRLVLEITDILMEGVPRHIDVAAVGQRMECCPGVIAIHDLHIWTISSGMYALSAHLVVDVDGLGRNDAILTEVKAGLRREFGIDHTTLQIESVAYAHVDDVHRH